MGPKTENGEKLLALPLLKGQGSHLGDCVGGFGGLEGWLMVRGIYTPRGTRPRRIFLNSIRANLADTKHADMQRNPCGFGVVGRPIWKFSFKWPQWESRSEINFLIKKSREKNDRKSAIFAE